LLEHRDDEPTDNWTYNSKALKDRKELGLYRFQLWKMRSSMPFGQFGVPMQAPASGAPGKGGVFGIQAAGSLGKKGVAVSSEAGLAGHYRMAAGYQAPVTRPQQQQQQQIRSGGSAPGNKTSSALAMRGSGSGVYPVY